ncbi:hypothetical protein [Horticoccus sp. 23ND18S-11]|uniref:hypothetical protein n=1 Tax=Horticoccus sp. 23ND18S-11 TaxID=3391832 RepID=UPI0039C9EFCD
MSKRFPGLVLSGRTGHMVALHRRLCLPCFPEAEAGPAAIGGSVRLLPSEVVSHAKMIQDGADKPGLGARKGIRQTVAVLSPMVPGLVQLAADVDWRLWEKGSFPTLNADVILVWRPCQILPRVRLADVACFLANAAFGGGAVYSGHGNLWDMIAAQRLAQQRSGRA